MEFNYDLVISAYGVAGRLDVGRAILQALNELDAGIYESRMTFNPAASSPEELATQALAMVEGFDSLHDTCVTKLCRVMPALSGATARHLVAVCRDLPDGLDGLTRKPLLAFFLHLVDREWPDTETNQDHKVLLAHKLTEHALLVNLTRRTPAS